MEYWHLLPMLPVITRGAIGLKFHRHMKDVLLEKELDREAHRTRIMGLAGFSFTGLMALIILEASVRTGLLPAIYFLAISFLAQLSALDLQGFKSARWEDLVGDAVMDIATFTLILAIVALLLSQLQNRGLAISLAVLGIGQWLFFHGVYLKLQCGDLEPKGDKHAE